jgi:hypothetical protein
MPWVGFVPTIAASERAKTVHASRLPWPAHRWCIGSQIEESIIGRLDSPCWGTSSLTFRGEHELQAFETEVLRKDTDVRRLNEQFRILHNVKLIDWSSIVTVIKWRRFRLVRHVPRMWYSKNVYRILMVKPRENFRLEDREGDWRIILRLT